ncbi:MAG: hypothetical protein IJ642_02875 [Oscillospiraceae bacterium]|nr:hypothetical protein [Oscillospiraceae bacterium]
MNSVRLRMTVILLLLITGCFLSQKHKQIPEFSEIPVQETNPNRSA